MFGDANPLLTATISGPRQRGPDRVVSGLNLSTSATTGGSGSRRFPICRAERAHRITDPDVNGVLTVGTAGGAAVLLRRIFKRSRLAPPPQPARGQHQPLNSPPGHRVARTPHGGNGPPPGPEGLPPPIRGQVSFTRPPPLARDSLRRGTRSCCRFRPTFRILGSIHQCRSWA